ncbi:MAG: glycosyltransferase family 4 protein [Chitinophagaceae bacterium]|nr:glycosyltransferase family 4 protein [Rubrivivax sp.]
MKILFCSVPYSPSVGGIETVSALLAEQFHRHGHEVTLVTQTPGTSVDPEPYVVVRNPDAARLWALVLATDLVFHNNISLRMAWPLLVLRKPWVVAHHMWIPRHGAGRIKRAVLRWATNIAVSRAMAADLPTASQVLPNPYRDDLFRLMAGVSRERDIVFLGRLVSDKGVTILLDALDLLARSGLRPQLTLVGDGPERDALQAQVRRQGLAEQVHFAGRRSGEALASLLNGHRLIVVPSTWEEPFGLVALEGLACGCVPVVARSGGLPEVIGPCGLVFEKGSATSLARVLKELLQSPARRQGLLAMAPDHLARHRPQAVASAYIRILTDACQPRRAALAA